MNPERTLWLTVLVKGLDDAAMEHDADWLGTADFRHVCALAGLDSDVVLEAYSTGRRYLPRAA
ncbi:hypothetical protein JMM61_19505 [Rhodovulum sulfidophilum]|uniref:hypothetical protein n=1 Tax=Rhodovulum sulfidophilum TaxID=35806 RepID=UPI001926B719|nr:hypothetical protein [Rhodovulum sulfidophilum]MBL3587525.1 hypothetical protein [Rhodovulum sulfidophilum]